MSNKCSLSIYKDGKELKGTAAQLHLISISGGWDKYHKNMIKAVSEETIKTVVPIVTNNILQQLSNKNFNKMLADLKQPSLLVKALKSPIKKS